MVAETDSALAPRGLSELGPDERNLAENLLLACGHCHNDIDKRMQARRLDVHWLLATKEQHEQRIREATELAANEKTVVLRLVGSIRGTATDVSALEAVAAVNALVERAPVLTLDPNRTGPEIDLRQLPGETNPVASGYYAIACQRIDQVLRERVKPAAERGEIGHLSVFGLARLPLLVYLGSRLDDAISADIFQRHRTTEAWAWGDEDSQRFAHETISSGKPSDGEGVLIVNISGTVALDAVPSDLNELPTFRIAPTDGVPHRDAIRTRAARDSFHDALSGLLGELEQGHKPIKRLHVIAAAPVSVAIILGRSVGWGFHPNLVVYDATDDGYQAALEVTAP